MNSLPLVANRGHHTGMNENIVYKSIDLKKDHIRTIGIRDILLGLYDNISESISIRDKPYV